MKIRVRTPFSHYTQQARRCKGRIDKNGCSIEMKLTFDEWWSIWQQSGHWEQRGIGRDKYVMSRINDTGHYEVGNVVIKTQAENMSEAKTGVQAWNKGKVCPQISAAQIGRKPWNKGITRHKALRFE